MEYYKIKDAIFYLILLVTVIIALVIGKHSYENMHFNSEPCYELESGWTYKDKTGNEKKVNILELLDVNKEGALEVSYTLPESLDKFKILCIRTVQQSLKVYIDDKLMYTYGLDKSKRMLGESKGNVWNMIRIPSDVNGKNIRIELDSPYRKSREMIYEVYGGTKASILFNLVGKYGGTLLISWLIFILGVSLLIMYGIFKRYLKDNKSTKYLGWFAVLISIWFIGESKLTQFFIGNPNVIVYINYISLILFPIPILQYISESKKHRFKKVIECFTWLFCINFIVVTLLQYFNIVDLYKSVILTHVLIALSCIVSVFMLIQEVKSRSIESIIHAIGFGVLCCFGILELIYFYTSKGTDIGRFMRPGVFVFVIVLSVRIIRKSIEIIKLSKRTMYYKKIATIDLMTNCLNRTAYTEKFDGIENGEGFSVVLVDMNNLKRINDVYGHQVGDEAIIKTAEYLKKVFYMKSNCYRIGGDEFVCLLKNWGKEKVEKASEKFLRECEEENKNCIYEFQVAIGYAFYNKDKDENLYSAVKRADNNMYDIKKQMKDQTT